MENDIKLNNDIENYSEVIIYPQKVDIEEIHAPNTFLNKKRHTKFDKVKDIKTRKKQTNLGNIKGGFLKGYKDLIPYKGKENNIQEEHNTLQKIRQHFTGQNSLKKIKKSPIKKIRKSHTEKKILKTSKSMYPNAGRIYIQKKDGNKGIYNNDIEFIKSYTIAQAALQEFFYNV